jgi:uncharacterized membrane protein YbaN (DUF454 family)
MRAIYSTLGIIFVIIGVIGIITPLLPTTPFLLLAAACFARGSDRFHHWLMTHPTLSKPIIDWQRHGVIRMPAKILATFFILLNLAFPLFIIKSISMPLKILTSVVAITVLAFIFTRPSVAKIVRSENESKTDL